MQRGNLELDKESGPDDWSLYSESLFATKGSIIRGECARSPVCVPTAAATPFVTNWQSISKRRGRRTGPLLSPGVKWPKVPSLVD